MYGKIFDSMYEGTLYGHWEAIVTLQQMLVLCSAEGVVDITPQAMSARTSIPLEIITKGIGILAEPDPYSRTPGDEGRRILLLDAHRPWGWVIVNYAKYQAIKSRAEKNEADRIRIAEQRKVNKIKDVALRSNLSQPVADVAPEAGAESESESKPYGAVAPGWLPANWQIYLQHRKESRKPLTATAQTAAINKLERWKAEGKDISAIITQSVENGWSGLFEVKQGVGQGKPSIAPPKLSCCVCGGVLRGFTETSQGKMCSPCWAKR